ncbi:hypothetical protein DJ010_11755 [Nocardioides silvaticus]|uniref:Uncharacterized protein n=1 Tax=Nocardioides silvaticus TaxID=2201891 RepID=A0A316TU56_9ACTN|nr:hypothetical protein DJ010_11755 [Nocardioides silvaticus]
MQRALLRAVEDVWTDLRPELWLCVTTVDLNLGEHRESRRRAAHGLAAANHVELRLADISVRSQLAQRGWTRREMLFARLPAGEATLEYAAELRAEYHDHLTGMWTSGPNEVQYREHYRWVTWYTEPERRDAVYSLDDDWHIGYNSRYQ